MKNFKKVLALVLAFSMVLSTMTAFAAEGIKYEEEADALYELGLFQGTSTTEKELNLEGDLTREQAMKLIATVLGWEVDEDATSEYDDVANWAQPYVAVAVEKGITNGVGGAFAGERVATMHELVTWYLRALGYDSSEAWTNAAALGVDAGIVLPVELVSFDKEIKRDELVGVSFKALTATPVGEDYTVAENLVANGVIDEELAIEYDLIVEPEAEKFAVVDVEAINLVQTLITFNKEVDVDSATAQNSTGRYTNIEVDKETVKTITVLEDGKSVLVTTANEVDNQTKATVEVDGVKSKDKTETIKKYEEEIEYTDFIMPEIESIEVIGTRLIEIKLSEPIKDADKGAFSVKRADSKGSYHIASANPVGDTNTTVHVKVYKDFEEGSYEIEVSGGVVDYAGYQVKATKEVVDVVEDKEGPVLVDVENVKSTEVTLVFDESLDESVQSSLTGAELKNAYHTNAKKYSNGMTIKANKLTITWEEDKALEDGKIFVTVASEYIKDNWGNLAGTIIAEIEREIDVEAPYIDELDAPVENEIEVTFSEAVEEDSAEEESNYTVIDSEGKEVNIKTVRHDGKVVTLEFKDDLSGDYIVEVKGVEDLSGNKADDSAEINVDDVTAPSFLDAKVYGEGIPTEKEFTLVIRFDDEMATDGKYSVLDLDKYQIGTVELEDISDVEIDLINDGKAVEIIIPKDKASDEGITALTTETLTIAKVADSSGNTTDILAADGVAISGFSTVAINSMELVSSDTVKFTFEGFVELEDEEFHIFDHNVPGLTETNVLNNAADVTSANNTLSSTDLAISAFDIDLNDDGDTTLSLTLNKDLNRTYIDDLYVVIGKYVIDTASGASHAKFETVSENQRGEKIDTKFNVLLADEAGARLADADIDDSDMATLDLDDKAAIIAVSPSAIKMEFVLTEYVTAASVDLASKDLKVLLNSSELVYGIGNDYELELVRGNFEAHTGVFTPDTTTGTNTKIIVTINKPAVGTNETIEDLFNAISRYELNVKLADEVNYIKDVAQKTIDELDVEFDLSDLPAVGATPNEKVVDDYLYIRN